MKRLALVTVLAAMATQPFIARSLRGQDTHLVIVAGLGGAPEITERFHGWASQMATAATERYGLLPESVIYLGERLELDPELVDGVSRKEAVQEAIEALSDRVAAEDHVFILLIGHGSYDGTKSSINLPGPDMSADEFNLLLGLFPTQRISFVNTASASGEFVNTLSGPNRTIVTATRTGGERNETMFGGFFVQAYANEEADLDKDGRISVGEAFTFATAGVQGAYEAEGRLATEHALLDDNGDGEGSGELEPEAGDGALASFFILRGPRAVGRSATGELPEDPDLRALYIEKAEIEQRVEALRMRRNEMDPEAYDNQLEEILLELALKNREIRTKEGGDG